MAIFKKEKATFPLKILSPEAKFFEGPVVSFSAANVDGPFDVLAKHTNFFSLLVPGKITIDTGNEAFEVEINSGIVKVSNHQATIFVNI